MYLNQQPFLPLQDLVSLDHFKKFFYCWLLLSSVSSSLSLPSSENIEFCHHINIFIITIIVVIVSHSQCHIHLGIVMPLCMRIDWAPASFRLGRRVAGVQIVKKCSLFTYTWFVGDPIKGVQIRCRYLGSCLLLI